MYWGPAAVLGLTVVSAVTDYMRQTTVQRAVIRTETDLQKAMFARLVGTDLAQLRSRGAGGPGRAVLVGHRAGQPVGEVDHGGHHRRSSP